MAVLVWHSVPFSSDGPESRSPPNIVRLNDIVQKVKAYQPGADTALIEKAYVFAAKCHDGQMRKSGDPYFVHPVSVAGIIAEMKLDVSSICAALSH